jgi:16S rRNA (adenine1518-N6/adenine1519-N6)-dimethyltransferase
VDHGVAPVLRDVVRDTANVSVIEADAREVDWNSIVPPHSRAVVVANLPYTVATPLVADLLDTVPQLDRFVVMVQKEVALRLAATAGSSDYGAVSVKVAYWATARILGDVPPTVFVPRPKVVSSVIEIRRRERPAIGSHIRPEDLFPIVRAAFGQRRKMLRRSLASMTSTDIFSEAGVSPEARPEDLDVEQWGRLTEAIIGARR